MYNHALIGNCQTAALVSENGSIDWMCLPRPDSPPVFGRILDPDGGFFQIGAPEGVKVAASRQRYIQNTNVLQTRVELADGSAFVITDFCPRFPQHGHMYRPIALFRTVEPVAGTPSIQVSCNPVEGWEKTPAKPVRGNSHVRWEIRGAPLRLSTNMSLTFLCEGTPFPLHKKVFFALTWDLGLEADLAVVTEEFLDKTADYWRTWVKHCSIPTLYQTATIRSALALKLHCYEDTGAILAALTTSLPECPGEGRNWDYRFCWLRDASFVLSAFHSLGHFEEMEGFLKFILDVAMKSEHSRDRLRPVYDLAQAIPSPENEHPNWVGFQGSRPVRSCNQAAEHVQNDVYGEMILGLAPIFLDERFYYLRTPEHERLLAHLGGFCDRSIAVPDAGLWEIRNASQEHSFTNLMCWAGLDRLDRLQKAGFFDGELKNLSKALPRAEAALRRAVVDGSLRNGPKDPTIDASLAQLPILRFPDRELCEKTVERIIRELRVPGKEKPGEPAGFYYRYVRTDDFGRPSSAFVICSFWIIHALARLGHVDQARAIMDRTLECSNSLGLIAEHFQPSNGTQLGNFPQAYSHVGLINAAFAVSPPWSDVL